MGRGAERGDRQKALSFKFLTLSFDTLAPHCTAEKNDQRFELTNGPAKVDINGRWAVTFAGDSTNEGNSIAEFSQNGEKLEGTFLTPTGDYRYLEGVVTGNKLKLSSFYGAHAYLFTADITDKNAI